MPEAIAAAVVSFFSLTGTAATVVSAAVQVAVIAGAGAVMKQNSEQKAQGQLIDLQLNSAAPRQLIVGKRMVGGVLVDWYLAGSNNTKLYMPTYLAEGPCGQITRVFAGGREVWGTPLVHGVRTTIPDFRSGGDRLWLTYYDGRVGQTADATLVGLGQGWTSANKMTGCAYVVIECQWDSDNMRSPPQLSFEMEGAKFYDRRKDTTAGGSGAHRIDNPATWEFSDNPMVALDHYMLGRYIGGVKTFGIGLSSDEVPYDRFAAQAAICDEDVTLKAGGTQKRYRANGFMFANEDYSSVIAKLCVAMAARPADFGGRFGVIGIESRTPVMTIDDADMIAGVAEVYTPKRSWAELVGAIEGRFQDPAQLYQPVDFPRVTDAAWEAQDGGEPKVFTLDLEFETDVERAQRLATLRARAERRQAMLRGVYPLKTVELERGDWFIRTGPKWGAGKKFEVIERALDTETWTVTIVSQEVDAADSAWNETTAQDGPPAPIASTDTLSDVTAPSLTVTSNPIAGAASSTPAIKIAFTNPTDPRVRHMFIEVYRTSDGLKVATETVGIPDADGVVIIQNGIADAVAHTVRARYLTVGLSSAWSTSYAVTTGAGYSVGTATAVPWAGVTSRPTNLSALAGTEPIQNALVAQGANGVIDGGFRTPSLHWSLAGFTTTPTVTYLAESQIRKARITGGASTPTGGTAQVSSVLQNSVPCVAGDRVECSAYFGAAAGGWNTGQLYVDWYTSAATPVYISSSFIGSNAMTGLTGTGDLSTFARVAGFATAPATTGIARMTMRFGNTTGSAVTSPVGTVCLPLIRRADATQTAFSPWTPGLDAVPGADITSANTAAAVTGQGDLATANRASLPFGVNGLVDTNFGWQSTYYAKDSVTGTTTFSTSTSTGGLKKGGVTGAGLTVNGTNYIRHHSIQQDAFFPCKPGDVIGARALIGTTNTSSIQLLIAFRDAAGTATGFSTATVLSTGLLAGGGEETTFNELTNVATAPAGTVTANIDIRAIASTAAPVLVVAKPMLALMQSGQTAVPAYSPGREHQIGADVTLSNTAAGITGQGTLATVSRPNVVSLTGTETLDNALIAQGANGVIDSGFRTPSLHWSLAGFLNTPTISYLAESQIRKARITGAASVPNTGTAQLSGQSGNAVPCVSGDRIEASAYFGAAASGWSSGQVYVDWYNASNTYLSSTFIGSATMSGALGNGDLSTFARVAGFATAPANTALARLSQRFVNASGGALTSPVGSTCLPLLRRADATQTAASLWSPGLDAVPGADITSANTAAGIAGQGDLATTNRASLPFGANVAANSDFANGAAYPPLGWTGGIGDTTGATFTGSIVTAGARRTLKVVLAGTTTGGTYFDAAYMPQSSLPLLQRWTLPVVAGDVVGGSALIAKNAAVSVALAIVCWYEASGAFLSQSNGNSVSASANGDTGNPADYTLSSVAATAPTNARFAILFVRGLASTGAVNATVWTMSPLLCRLPAGQTVVPAYSPGPTDRLADQTAANTASAITAQGTQATANAQRGSTYSGTPVEGSWWADTSTTPNKLKFYTGGAWQVVATLVSDAAANALSVSFSPASVNTTHTTNTPLSQAVTATVTGGSGTYTYVWAVGDVFSGSAPTLTNQYTATCTVNVAHSAIATIDGAISCTITDTVTGKSIVRYWGYYSQGTGGGGGAGGGGGLPP
jgi:hypothetical protein